MEVNIPTRAQGKPSPEPAALQFLPAALRGQSFIGLLVSNIHPPQAYASLVICEEVSPDCDYRSVVSGSKLAVLVSESFILNLLRHLGQNLLCHLGQKWLCRESPC